MGNLYKHANLDAQPNILLIYLFNLFIMINMLKLLFVRNKCVFSFLLLQLTPSLFHFIFFSSLISLSYVPYLHTVFSVFRYHFPIIKIAKWRVCVCVCTFQFGRLILFSE